MTSNYTEKFLSEVALISSGKRPPEVCKDRNTDAQVPVIGGGGPSGFTAHPLTLEPTLITGRVGTLGKLHVSTGPAWPSDNALVIRPRSGIVSFDYLRYALTAVIHQAIGMNRGAANPLVTQSDLGKLLIPVPSSSVQARISLILRSLDDQIEILRENNATLEAIAQAIFKSWFIDFDPVKAKSEGRVPDGIDEATAALFPDSFEDSKNGSTPVGWQWDQLGRWLSVLETGRRPKGGVSHITEGVPSIGAESIVKVGAFDFSKTKYVERAFFESMKAGKLQSHDVLLYKDGGKPGTFLPRVSMFGDGFPFRQCGINEHVFRLRINSPFPQCFLYFWLWSDKVMHELKHRGGKAAIPGINQSDVREQLLLVPSNAVLEAFAEMVDPLLSLLFANSSEIQTLTQLRDTLLPRLISGKLKLPEMQELAEAL